MHDAMLTVDASDDDDGVSDDDDDDDGVSDDDKSMEGMSACLV